MISLSCKGILFDCDGVLVDSDVSVLRSWRRWAVEFGLDPEGVLPLIHGRRSADTVAQLLPASRRADGVALIDRIELDDAGSMRAIPGAVRLVTSMPAGSWAVVTSGTNALATARLRAAAFPVPDVLITADDVTRGKPDPEGYRAAAAQLGRDPGDTIVLEDAQTGIEAAYAAGVSAVVGVGRDNLRADVVVPDLTALRWADNELRVEDGLADVTAPRHG